MADMTNYERIKNTSVEELKNMSNAIPIADDIWEPLDNSRAYYDGYRCRKCGTVIVVEDYLDLPCYCKECEKYDQL